MATGKLHLRAAASAHYLSIAGSTAFWAFMDRHLWFFGDEWDFLVHRGLSYRPTDPRSIWYPHEEHWSTLPILLWRGLFNVFHLSSYVPYLVPLLIVNAVAMHMLWRLSIRAGASPWLATAVVALLGVAGAGAEDMAWAFQVGFVGSLALGLVALWLAGAHRSDAAPVAPWRDRSTAALLVASLMCSTVGNAMVVAVAFVLFAQRPPRRAAIILAWPVVAYCLWWVLVGRLGLSAAGDHFSSSTVTTLPGFVTEGLATSLGAFSNCPAAGTALLVALTAWLVWRRRALWVKAPELAGLAAGAVAFYVLVAVGRDTLDRQVAASRYVYIVVALLIPLIAVALSSFAWVGARLTVVGLLGLTAVGNIGQAQTFLASRDVLVDGLEAQTLAIARLVSSGHRDVLGQGTAPVPYSAQLTVGALAALWRVGYLSPGTGTVSGAVQAEANQDLAVTMAPGPVSNTGLRVVGSADALVSSGATGCLTFTPTTLTLPISVSLQFGQSEMMASVEVRSLPVASPPDTAIYASLAPRHGRSPGVPPEALPLPATGVGYLSDNDPDDRLVLDWTAGEPLSLCGVTPQRARPTS